jgi:hypothetical protein
MGKSLTGDSWPLEGSHRKLLYLIDWGNVAWILWQKLKKCSYRGDSGMDVKNIIDGTAYYADTMLWRLS